MTPALLIADANVLIACGTRTVENTPVLLRRNAEVIPPAVKLPTISPLLLMPDAAVELDPGTSIVVNRPFGLRRNRTGGRPCRRPRRRLPRH